MVQDAQFQSAFMKLQNRNSTVNRQHITMHELVWEKCH